MTAWVTAHVKSFMTLTIHNGSTRKVVSEVPSPGEVKDNAILLPTGVWYDPDSGGTVPNVIPGIVPVEVWIKEETRSALENSVNNYEFFLGLRGTLTAEKSDGSGNITCTARLMGIELATPFPVNNMVTKRKLRLRFRCYSNWA